MLAPVELNDEELRAVPSARFDAQLEQMRNARLELETAKALLQRALEYGGIEPQLDAEIDDFLEETKEF